MRLVAQEELSGDVCAAIEPGFPLADIYDSGPSVLVYGPDAAACEAAAQRLYDALLAQRAAFSGRLYSGPTSFAPGDMLPTPPDTDSYFLVTLTPDGNKILVLRKTYTSASQTTLASQAIDVYSTSPLITKIGSIPLTTDASFCNSNSDDCFYGNQYLLPTQDGKAVFWIGNQNLQVFNIP